MPYLSPPTLTRVEVESLLAVTRGHPRDHLVIALALGTGLRLGEIVELNVGDVYLLDGTPRTRVRLRAEIAKGGRVGDVFLPDALLPKLRRLRHHKAERRESLDPDAPLFCNQGRRRISKRRVQVAFRGWQVAAGFDRLYCFHACRHYADSWIMPSVLPYRSESGILRPWRCSPLGIIRGSSGRSTGGLSNGVPRTRLRVRTNDSGAFATGNRPEEEHPDYAASHGAEAQHSRGVPQSARHNPEVGMMTIMPISA